MLKEFESVPNLPLLEKETIEYWKKIDVVKKLKSLRVSAEEKVYYDGPITANGLPHYGHAISWTLKDIIPRYWSMKGYLVLRNMGWDCQGIPVEYEVEKELNFERKEDIERFGIEKFNELCKKSILKYRDAIFDYETKLGRWFDEDVIYATMDKAYIESMWWSLKQLYEKGFLYEGHKTVAYSTRAGTTLSSHEVAEGGYKEIEDTYITVKFRLKNSPDTFILAWTTTPWTIPGNLMLAIGKDIAYIKIKYLNEYYIVAKDRVEDIFKEKQYEIKENISSTDLIDKEYIPPFDFFESKRTEGCFRIIEAWHANSKEGTGIVHLAPYGAEDFDIFMSLGIKLFDYLDDTANFTGMLTKYKGLFYKEANPKIVEDLKQKTLLFNTGIILHRMPMCWRTGTPLIYKPIKSWYIAVTKLKDRMLQENQQVNWFPEHLKNGNSGMWISNARDWALSRSRYWGTPLPVWINDLTGEKVFIGSFSELKEKSGIELEDPHTPFVDNITWEDKQNGGIFKRVKDVIDVWYDSGSMPFARWHYPFENKDKFENSYPAEYIAEGPDQIRLWFYVMHVLGVALFNKIPYKNVITTGMLLDSTGKKMSKSKRNYKPMDEVLEEYGADVLRYFILTSSIVNGQDAVFSSETLSDAKKEFFLPLWNSAKYLATYVTSNNLIDLNKIPKPKNILDRWILIRLQETINEVVLGLDTYQILTASKTLGPFVTDLSTWYIRRSRDRIKNKDKTAIQTLYYVLFEFTKLIAPFVPFISEELYRRLDLKTFDSVHMELYPKTRELTFDEKMILEKMTHTRSIVSATLAIRVDEKIKIRQPLEELYIENLSDENNKIIEYYEDLIKDELNIKSVAYKKPGEIKALKKFPKLKYYSKNNYNIWLNTALTKALEIEGNARELIRKVQDLRKAQRLLISDKINIIFESNGDNNLIIQKFSKEIKRKTNAKSLIPGKSLQIRKV